LPKTRAYCREHRPDLIAQTLPVQFIPIMNGLATIYAHSLPRHPQSEWESLEAHASSVALLARSFSDAFGSGDWGELLGRWHDLGKGSEEFQAYLRATADPDAGENEDAPGRVDHSTCGARHAAQAIRGHFGQLLALCIAGHHGSIPDATTDDAGHERSTLAYRLNDQLYRIPPVQVADEDCVRPKLRLPFEVSRESVGFQIAFFTRLLFSALVDADRTATEAFCDPSKATERSRSKPSVGELRVALDAFMHQKQTAATPTPVNRLRASVLGDCLAAAPHCPGFFSLNVPTGGGKTFASLAFALHHAQKHQMRRVVVAVPFTSIIEQTADEYRKALGFLAGAALVEHHSNINPKVDTRHNKLAAENWDAPLIVTTNVQLYESLFAATTTPCRKLHRLVGSVIVLDEAQTIPVEFLRPTLLALKELVAHYKCTVVLCTATQPALERREGFDIGVENVRPIIREPEPLFAALKRVEVSRAGKLLDDTLASRLSAENSVLCIVNTRPHAAKLYDALISQCDKESCFHLSTFMCAQHRRDALAMIRKRLADRKPCRVVSTQLIEAGVDVDFAVVYRAPAGFDSIAQAAGRCNREGRLEADCRPILGRVYLFETECPPPPGFLRSSAQCGKELIDYHSDPITPEAIEAYFRLFYWSQKNQWDKNAVLDALDDDFRDNRRPLRLKMRTAASRYQIIDDDQASVVVPYDANGRAIRNRLLRSGEVDFGQLREAQRYLVGVRHSTLDALCSNNVVIEHDCGLWLLINDEAYSHDTGLRPQAVGIDPTLMIY
jgi:CRISPR-associated endonuclease/helicase Cas3